MQSEYAKISCSSQNGYGEIVFHRSNVHHLEKGLPVIRHLSIRGSGGSLHPSDFLLLFAKKQILLCNAHHLEEAIPVIRASSRQDKNSQTQEGKGEKATQRITARPSGIRLDELPGGSGNRPPSPCSRRLRGTHTGWRSQPNHVPDPTKAKVVNQGAATPTHSHKCTVDSLACTWDSLV